MEALPKVLYGQDISQGPLCARISAVQNNPKIKSFHSPFPSNSWSLPAPEQEHGAQVQATAP